MTQAEANLDDSEQATVSRKRARYSETRNKPTKFFSVEFPNLETLNWIGEQVRFIGPLQWQDTRLGEARHSNAKSRKRLTNGHNDARDILLVVCDCVLSKVFRVSTSFELRVSMRNGLNLTVSRISRTEPKLLSIGIQPSLHRKRDRNTKGLSLRSFPAVEKPSKKIIIPFPLLPQCRESPFLIDSCCDELMSQ